MNRSPYQNARIAVAAAWLVGPLWSMMLCFYLGTIWATPSVIDLQKADVVYGFRTGFIGLLIGVVFAIAVTVFYPPKIAREERLALEHDH
ncbi:hypothetical protein BH11ARM1_BH11ARM1_14370 [soil metagenome]